MHRNTHTQGLIMEELFNEPDDLQIICIRQLHHTCTRLSPPIYRDVRDVLVTLPSPIIYLYRDHLFEAMWDEVDFKLFTLFDLCEELLRQRELTSPTSVTLLDKCRTDVVRFCGHLSFSQIHAIMSRFPPLILDQLGSHFNKCNWASVMSDVIRSIRVVPLYPRGGSFTSMMYKHIRPYPPLETIFTTSTDSSTQRFTTTSTSTCTTTATSTCKTTATQKIWKETSSTQQTTMHSLKMCFLYFINIFICTFSSYIYFF